MPAVTFQSTNAEIGVELTVNTTSLGDAVEFLTHEDGCVLDRDSVAALVGQLSSWLARTAAEVPAS